MEIREIRLHGSLTEFYRDNGLETESGWEKNMNPVKSIGAYENGALVGAATVSFRLGFNVLDYIAVRENERNRGVGALLLKKIYGGSPLYLAARTPGFFYALGCLDAPEAEVLLSECEGCVQRGRECNPRALKFTGGNI